MATIRPARPEDARAIAAIWNPMIRDTLATFNSVEHSAQDIAAMLAADADRGRPWLVAEVAAEAVGFARFSQFRAGVGYAHTMEHTIMLREAVTRRGIGRRLMTALAAGARAAGAHSLIGAISAENPAGLAFHARCGFVEVGRIPQAGRKFDRWLDLVLMQRRL